MTSSTHPRLTTAAGILLLAACIFAPACGGLTEADDGSPAAMCRRGGGEWESDGCNGSGDHCHAVACEPAIGLGCQCKSPGLCWDGLQCVSEGD